MESEKPLEPLTDFFNSLKLNPIVVIAIQMTTIGFIKALYYHGISTQ